MATPIGNLEDISFRAARILKEVDYIYCEDTRRTGLLLKNLEIEPRGRIKSFHDHSSRRVLIQIQDELRNGCRLAYVTDAGFPVISDPGYVLVQATMECHAKLHVIPGPTVAPMLFALSGFPTPKYLFHGFFPRSKGEVEKVLTMISSLPVAHVFYESPMRVLATLEILKRNLPKALCVFGRELTKVHEEVLRGTPEHLLTHLSEREKIKGECALAIYQPPKKDLIRQSDFDREDSRSGRSGLTQEQEDEIAQLVKKGHHSKDISKELSKKFNVSRRIIYEFIIRHLT